MSYARLIYVGILCAMMLSPVRWFMTERLAMSQFQAWTLYLGASGLIILFFAERRRS